MFDLIENRKCPVLIYCDSSSLREYAEHFKQARQTVFVNNCDMQNKKLSRRFLENLHDLNILETENYPILLVDDAQYMRGHDYRSNVGITLILCKGFKTPRDVT